MSYSYLVVQDAFGKSTGLACDECGHINFAVVWDAEPISGPKKIEAVCVECLARMTLALEYDPFAAHQAKPEEER